MEFGLKDEYARVWDDGKIHKEDFENLVLLNRFGAGADASIIDACEKYWLPTDTYPTKMTLFSEPGYGIVGSKWIISNADKKEYGDTSSANPSTVYEFTETNRLIGMEGVSGFKDSK